MTNLQAEVFEAFRAIDVPEDKALKAATAWMIGFVLAFQVVIAANLFVH